LLKSDSVHEEIRYAIGIDTHVLVDEKLRDKEEGVFIYGNEYEYFIPKFFEQDADIIAHTKFLHCKLIKIELLTVNG
jgi:hypothetical protein